MIPKQLFFVWFGNNKPDYVDFSINAFKKYNPTYNVELIYEKNIFSSDNKDIKNLLELCNDKNSLYYKLYNRSWAKQNLLNTEIGRIVCFSDCYRIFLLNKYGGIYLDCDMYPIKSFDEDILKYKRLVTKAKSHNKKITHGWYDCYFIGSEIGYGEDLYKFHFINKSNYSNDNYNIDDLLKDTFVYNTKTYIAEDVRNCITTNEYREQYNNFYKCIDPKIFNPESDMYFEHYRYISWYQK